MATYTDIFNKSNAALDTLYSVWESMLTIIQAVSAASSKSLTTEPDLAALQKARKDYEALLGKLSLTAIWLEDNKDILPNISTQDTSSDDSPERKQLLSEQETLRNESERLSNQLKRLLSQSYALQFQIDMLLSSSYDQDIDNQN
ncbi:hypothetical protein CLU79DRAFT_768310 [Phycomyces nitens]|nr:hypothetical protein CLU79DRAFT_768310 [Phycomyces nitens]